MEDCENRKADGIAAERREKKAAMCRLFLLCVGFRGAFGALPVAF